MAKLLFVLALVACAYAQDYDAIFDTLMNTCGMHTCDNNQLNLSSDECWTCLTEECGTRRQRARFEAEIDQLTDDENGACATVFGCAVGCGTDGQCMRRNNCCDMPEANQCDQQTCSKVSSNCVRVCGSRCS